MSKEVIIDTLVYVLTAILVVMFFTYVYFDCARRIDTTPEYRNCEKYYAKGGC